MLTLAALALLFTLALYGLFLHVQRCALARERSGHYFDVIGGLRKLFEHMPQHRGMANAYLRGDDSFKERLVQTQREIDNEINELDGLLDGESDDLLVERWGRVKAEWHDLKSRLSTMEPPQSFNAHTHLVLEVIYLVGDAAERSKSCRALADVKGLSDIVFTQLPMMMEFVGRARGIGTGAANSQRLSVANRVELGFYAARVEEAVANSSRVVDGLAGQAGLSSIKGVSEESQRLTLEFIDRLKHDLLAARKIEIKPAEYYDAGTAAIGKNLNLFDRLLPVIVDSVKRNQARQRASIVRYAGAMVVFGIVLAWQGYRLL